MTLAEQRPSQQLPAPANTRVRHVASRCLLVELVSGHKYYTQSCCTLTAAVTGHLAAPR